MLDYKVKVASISMFQKLKYLLYRFNELESKVTELERYIGLSNSSDFADLFLTIGSNTTSLKGSWERLDNFQNYKRSRGMLSSKELYVGLDGSPAPGALKRFDGCWHDAFVNQTVDDVATVIKHGQEIWFGGFSKKYGASVWRGDGYSFEKVGHWKGFFGVPSLCSHGGVVFAALAPFSKNQLGAPIMAFDGQWCDIYSDHRYLCVYDMQVHNGNLYLATYGVDSFVGHVLELKNGRIEVLAGDGRNGSWKFQEDILRLHSHEKFLIAVGNRTPALDGNFYNIWGLCHDQWSPFPKLPRPFSNLSSFNAVTVFKNKLVVGCGGRPEGQAAVLVLDNQDWKQIGGRGINGSWSPNIHKKMNKGLAPKSSNDYVYQFCHHNEKLIVGFGACNGCGQVWQFSPL